MKTLRVVFCLVVLPMLPVPAMADGTHGTSFTVVNASADVYLCVDVFNGDDAVCVSPHKVYPVAPGETQVMKCHGNGQRRCKIKVHRRRDGDNISSPCKKGDRSPMERIVGSRCDRVGEHKSWIEKNDACTYTATKGTDGNVSSEALTCGASYSKIRYTGNAKD